jgi:hypothetical protein
MSEPWGKGHRLSLRGPTVHCGVRATPCTQALDKEQRKNYLTAVYNKH